MHENELEKGLVIGYKGEREGKLEGVTHAKQRPKVGKTWAKGSIERLMGEFLSKSKADESGAEASATHVTYLDGNDPET